MTLLCSSVLLRLVLNVYFSQKLLLRKRLSGFLNGCFQPRLQSVDISDTSAYSILLGANDGEAGKSSQCAGVRIK